MLEKRKNTVLTFFLIAVFLFFLLFYTRCYPILPSDMDDWAYIYPRRMAVPIWKVWNPIRVFAEVGMPAVSMMSSVVFMPFTGNVFDAMMIGFALCMAAAITGLLFAFCKMLQEKKYPVALTLFWAAFFLLSHFWIFRTEYQQNDYMLRTSDTCTYFFYVIPNLMNAAAVLWLEADPGLRDLRLSEGSGLKKSVFFLLAYFCIFSNIWAGMILASYLGSVMIFHTAAAIRDKKRFHRWISENSMLLVLIVMWLVSQFFELNGMRAAEVAEDQPLEIRETLAAIPLILKAMNRRYMFTAGLLFAVGGMALLRTKEKEKMLEIYRWGMAGLLAFLYLVLSCGKVGASYFRRPDVFYGVFFFCSVLVVLTGAAMIKRFSFVKLVLPLALVIILSDCNSPGKTWCYSNFMGLPPRIVNNINNDIVSQLRQAEQEGKDSTTIFIPALEGEDNGLYNVRGTEIVGETMWKLGVLERNIVVDYLVPTQEKNYLLETSPICYDNY